MKYAWIKSHRDSFPVKTMCRVLRVSSSGYYSWLKGKQGPRAERTAAIQADVRNVYEQSNGIYGSYKIADKLKADDRMQTACRNTVASAMREMGLKSRVCKQFRPTTTVPEARRWYSQVAAPRR